ncbi:MAG TPA: C10 family peptidase [Candidatus Krumholzibacteria bacterium]|nr:C10 family peptidase [Candidatus Krumholzibacteria bacterium]HPD70646.1 C10 family peptidase [Candidatus Krumholzibacteria bacterium]HRY39654.1 C10 family peptidase [Candidatus Krumholzibacteria bacterium]
MRHRPAAVLLGCAFGLLAAQAAAAPVTADLAWQVAWRHARELGVALGAEPAIEPLIDGRGQVLGYLVALEPTGYVAVAGDDGLPPVLAYSTAAAAPPRPDGDPLRALLRADVAARLAAGQATARYPAWDAPPARARFEQWPPAGSTATGGWVEVRWSQGSPYNQYCPRDLAHGGARSLAGCPAVAMGQILDYLRAGAEVRFDDADDYNHNYYGNNFRIDDDWLAYGFPSWPQLDTYLATLEARWEAGLATDAAGAGALVYACGVAAHQVYSASGSGTYGVDQAYLAYQRFGFADCELIAPDAPDLLDRLAADMQGARPAHLAVVTPDWQAGHNVVVDGYNTDGYFHVNFGWGGSYDGWYLLPSGLPYELTVFEGVVVDIAAPATAAPAAPAAIAPLVVRAWPNPCNPRTVIGFTTTRAGRVGVRVYDARGRLVRELLDVARPAGAGAVSWDGRDGAGRPVAAGTYLVRVAAAGSSATTKLALAR